MKTLLLRFKDGLDVISFVEHDELLGQVTLTNPMMFEIRGTKMVLEHWLPVGIMQSPSVTIYSEDILCEMIPTETFSNYYEGVIADMQKVLNNTENKSPKDPNCDIMYSCFDDLDTNLIH